MSFNGAGVFSINTAGQPVVSGTTISATAENLLTADIATGLSTCMLKDGTQTITANIPMGGFRFTGLGAPVSSTDSARLGDVQGNTSSTVTGIAGTNTITGSTTPGLTAYATGQVFKFVPAATNSGATTLNIDSLGAKSIFWNNAALVGGELQINVPVSVYYDGTQFQLIGSGAFLNGNVPDNFFTLQDNSDRTKQAQFQLSGLTTGTTRTLTLPDASITLARIDAAQTFAGTQSFTGLIDASAAGAGQLKFPATQNASANANTLDDYQEGVSWTPTDASGASLSLTVVAADCVAYKVGRLVTCLIDITYPSTANGSNAVIGGLPYTALTTTNPIMIGTVYGGTSTTNLNVIVNSNSTTMGIYQGGSARTNTNQSTSTLRGMFTYIAAA